MAISSRGGNAAAESLTRVLYPDDSTSLGKGACTGILLVACSLADLVRRFRQNNDDWNLPPTRSQSS